MVMKRPVKRKDGLLLRVRSVIVQYTIGNRLKLVLAFQWTVYIPVMVHVGRHSSGRKDFFLWRSTDEKTS
jgi:hypothetical protein